jgi:hypothetical protein
MAGVAGGALCLAGSALAAIGRVEILELYRSIPRSLPHGSSGDR